MIAQVAEFFDVFDVKNLTASGILKKVAQKCMPDCRTAGDMEEKVAMQAKVQFQQQKKTERKESRIQNSRIKMRNVKSVEVGVSQT